jgi:hypothetical protein
MKYGLFASGGYASGKISTLREFGRLLGKFVSVFSCTDSSDILDINRTFMGTVLSGCFCIYAKLNTQPSKVLSHLINSITLIRESSLRREITNITLFGRAVRLPSLLGCFATFHDLPQSNPEAMEILQNEMRPVSFIQPCTATVCQGLLTSNGFKQAGVLGPKLAMFFKIASHTLSRQKHYDFSLRTIHLAISYILSAKSSKISEMETISQGLLNFIEPKLVVEDIDIFHGILQKVFERNIALGFQTSQDDIDVESIKQIASAIEAKRPCLIVGGCASGKTRIIKKAAKQSRSVLTFFNPEAFSSEFSWNVKIESSTTREVTVFDTEINKSSAGKIITLVDELSEKKLDNIIIETNSLAHSWGYFTSRFHIIYKHSEWKWQTALKIWLKSLALPKEKVRDIHLCFGKYMLLITGMDKPAVPLNVAFAGLVRLLQCLLLEEQRINGPACNTSDLFIFALIWSIGPLMNSKEQVSFQDAIMGALDGGETAFSGIDVKRMSIFDLVFDMSIAKWRKWMQTDYIPAKDCIHVQRTRYKFIAGKGRVFKLKI